MREVCVLYVVLGLFALRFKFGESYFVFNYLCSTCAVYGNNQR